MLGIGDFARHGRVSVRMLRHYDCGTTTRSGCCDRRSLIRKPDTARTMPGNCRG
jgi:hypothetical protein